MNYTLCVPHFCVNFEKYETNKKKNYYGILVFKQAGALRGGGGGGRCVGEILMTSFQLPVLSCSQPLKNNNRIQDTIYNVLALDRCSTCVTVLIYETKMVTVNYVFLCAFF